MPFVGTVDSIDPEVPTTVWVDFGRYLPPGTTLSGTPGKVVAVYSGTDPDPSAIVSEAPAIGTVPAAIGGTGLTNTAVLMQVTGDVAETEYTVQLTCGRSDGSDEVSGILHIPIGPEQPS